MIMTRLNWFEISPDGAIALLGALHHIIRKSNLSAKMIHMVCLRTSQLNGCAQCIHIHSRELRKFMEDEEIALIQAWGELPNLFSEKERAALAWTEKITLLAKNKITDPDYKSSCTIFREKDLVDLSITIATVNAFNRLGSSFRMPAIRNL